MVNGKIHVAIGFATGRIGFKDVLRSYIYQLRETHFLDNQDLLLSLFVAYDPTYRNTKREDYESLPAEERKLFHVCRFIGPEDIRKEKERISREAEIPEAEADLAFGTGYAVQRNIILFEALREKVDYIIFLDDDEYPLAVTESSTTSLWSGQHVLEDHVKYLQFSDYTCGYHCGYVTPMPAIEFDGILSEDVFHQFTDALSSDVLQWDSVSELLNSGGVTYADKKILVEHKVQPVAEDHGARIVTGGNLGINLTNPKRVLPFYNPPGARGEDSILSTCLGSYNVKKIPAYTFHDGFAFYSSLLRGALPMKLKRISLYDSAAVNQRFYRACVGWARYKPLYTYLTQPEQFSDIMSRSLKGLDESLPCVCSYFNSSDFMNLRSELEKYTKEVPEHNREFTEMRRIWSRIIPFACGS